MASISSPGVAFDSAERCPEEISTTGWRRRVLCIALLGYAYIVFVGGSAALTLPLIAKWTAAHTQDSGWPLRVIAHLGAVVLVYAAFCVAASTIRGFFLSRQEVDGLVLGDDTAMPLRSLIADLASQLRSKPPLAIALTYDGSSWLSIRTHESGRSAATIYIGIAALLVLTPEQLAATLAHELAHLRTRDARLSCFIERALERWCAYAVLFRERRRFGALPLAIASPHSRSSSKG